MGNLHRSYKEIKKLYESGWNIDEIAEKVGEKDVIEIYNVVTTGVKYTTKKERAEMLYLRGKGYSIRQIANEVGKSPSCVRSRLMSESKSICCVSDTKISNEMMEKILELKKQNLNHEDIANAVGISLPVLNYRLKKMANIKRRYVTDKDIWKFVRAYHKGYTPKQIAKKYGWSVSTIKRYIW